MTANWLAQKMKDLPVIESASVISTSYVEFQRKKMKSVVVGTVGVECLDITAARQIITGMPNLSFIVNVPRESYTTGAALNYALGCLVPIGGVGDLTNALDLPDIRTYVNREVAYIERGLQQHVRVSSFERIDDRRYRIERKGYLEDVTVIFVSAYELTADRVRAAKQRYGYCDMIVNTHPYGKATSSAVLAGSQMSVAVLQWKDFFSQLHK